MLKGTNKDIIILSRLLETLGLEPHKTPDKYPSVKTTVFYIANNGTKTSIRLFIDERTDEGSIKIKESRR